MDGITRNVPISGVCQNTCAVPPPSNEIDRELLHLEAELKRLEAEYNMYFAGRTPRPPWETRKQVDNLVKRLDRSHISNYGDRFRFTSLQARYAKFVDLWDKALRAKEEGRPSPLVRQRQADPREPGAPKEKVLHTATFNDPVREIDKLRDLYDSLAEARREAGQDAIPFHKFADLIKTQVSQIRQKGGSDVAFRVAVKDGKVAFTAKATKGDKSE
jgi:hypothetical protein